MTGGSLGTRKTCLITGATSGIGRAAALQLAEMGIRLVLVGRNESRGSEVAAACRKRGSPDTVFLGADIGSQAQVHRLAETVRHTMQHLDILIANAGARFDQYGETEDGIERTFAVNHLGHFLLTALLLDRLVAAPAARIIVTGSIAHRHVDAEGDWCLQRSNWNKRIAYGKSKLANIVFAKELARRLKGTAVTVNAVDPGTPLTRFAQNNGWTSWVKHVGYHLSRRELTMARFSGELVAAVATEDAFAGKSGAYISKQGEGVASKECRDPRVAGGLWDLSLGMTNLEERIGPSWRHLQPVYISRQHDWHAS